jgi:hypothetical protein
LLLGQQIYPVHPVNPVKFPSFNCMVPAKELSLGALFLFCAHICQAQPVASGIVSNDSTNYVCIQRALHSKVWQRQVLRVDNSGNVTTNYPSYTELATGICFFSNGQYFDSVEQVESVAGGAQAIQGRHQVQWALNANTPGGAVTVITPDAKQLSSTVFGLAYYDVASGSNAAIGRLKDCNGSIAAPNQVLYADAFSNVTADVLYTYTKAGLSQDIVLRESPPPPDTYGLSDETTIFQIYTEFMNPPQPEMTAVTNGAVMDAQVLDFGDMKIGIGQALFLDGENSSVSAGLVSKQWVHVNNGTFLVESIPYQSISNQLQALPQAANFNPGRGSIRRLALLDSKPPHPASLTKVAKAMTIARTEAARPRLRMDYELLSSSTNLTLQGDTTYFVTGAVNITGTMTVEGGTVVKYTNSSSAQIQATNIVCQTAPYRPGVFTSLNDNSVGSPISGSTGVPSVGAADYLSYSALGANSLVLKNLRFSYASEAITGTITSIGVNSIAVWDCQFVNCQDAFGTGVNYSYSGSDPGFPVYLYNVLFSQFSSGFAGLNTSGHLLINAVNVTADQMGSFQAAGLHGGTANSCSATNCLFTSVTNLSGISLANCYTNASSSGIYQTVGGGSYYLAAGSPYRDAGTTSIPSALLGDLQDTTTYPPVVVPAGSFTNNYTFFPQAQRDTDTPDLGYHYCPLDFALSMAVSNATVTVLPGTALAGCGTQYGVYLYTNATFNCQGTANSPNYFVRYNAVQEQSTTNWASATWGELMVAPSLPDVSLGSFGFTVWSVLAGESLYSSFLNTSPLWLQNCQLYNGMLTMEGTAFLSTNCLYRRADLNLYNRTIGGGGPSTNVLFNNLFWQGSITSEVHHSPNVWTFQDNLFDECSNTVSTIATDICSNNAYVTTNFGTLSYSSNDIVLTSSPAYQTGALGIYYYPTNLSLIHAGSRLAAAAGLYHYTATTNNVIEGTNVVSIGFHYVAVGSNGLPLDNNGDGISDYLEDSNGNGLVDSGEIDWQVAGDLGLTVIITRPVNNSTVP